MNFTAFKHQLFHSDQVMHFNESAVALFHYQYLNNEVYRQFVDALGVIPQQVYHESQIPFLPVQFFKSHRVVTGDFQPEAIFESSGTTSSVNSKHYVADLNLYEKSFSTGMELFYGKMSQYAVFALLPSYLERKNSSLVYMVEKLLLHSNRQLGGFYLNELDLLHQHISEASSKGLKIMLIGVTFALLDMLEKHNFHIPDAVIIETGGMKGRRREMIRTELHDTLCKGFGVSSIHSEYGMTELLSQAWSKGEGRFFTPPWMKVFIADANDPLTLMPNGSTGGINIIDLANIHSCAFIATQDLGRTFEDGSFEVQGRFDYSDIRGCSLLTV